MASGRISEVPAAADSWDDEVASAKANLADMRSNLAALKARQASLEKTARDASAEEASLKGKLADVLRQGAELQREDAEHLIYTDEGWGPWEGDFRGLWEPLAPQRSLAERPMLRGGAPNSRPALHAEALLGAEVPAPGPGFGGLGRAELVSKRPLMVLVPDFASPEECAGLIELGFRNCKCHNKWAQEAQRPGEQRAKGKCGPVRGVATGSLKSQELPGEDRELLERMQRRVAALTGVPEHDREIRPFLKFDQPGEGLLGQPQSRLYMEPGGADRDDLSIGLHLDVNGGFDHCVCSVIIYLNACEGGRTVFPCAGDERSCELGSELTNSGHTHTSHKSVHESGLSQVAAELVEHAEESPRSLRVAPRRGAALLFFSLMGEAASGIDSGGGAPARDPRAWHGGAAVEGALGKWTLQIFKEVPLEHRGGDREVSYVDGLRRRVLQAAEGLSGRIEAGAEKALEAEATAGAATICLSAMD